MGRDIRQMSKECYARTLYMRMESIMGGTGVAVFRTSVRKRLMTHRVLPVRQLAWESLQCPGP